MAALLFAAPASAASKQDHSECHRGSGDVAIAACTRVVNDRNESRKNRAIAYNNRGIARHNKGDLERAIEDYNEAIRLNPRHAGAYYNRGVAWRNKGDLERAIEDYSEAIRLNPRHAGAYNNRGIAWKNKGDLERAIEDYDEAIRLNPRDAGAYYNRGAARQNKGELERAIEDYSEAIRLNPRHAGAYNNRGIAWQNKGDLERAIEDYSEAIRLNPSDPDTYNSRCWARVTINRDLALALADCNRSLEIKWTAAASDSRGWVHFRLGRLDDAIRDYDAALKSKPKQAASLYGRGLAKLRKGERTGLGDLEAAKALDPKIVDEFRSYGINADVAALAPAPGVSSLPSNADFALVVRRSKGATSPQQLSDAYVCTSADLKEPLKLIGWRVTVWDFPKFETAVGTYEKGGCDALFARTASAREALSKLSHPEDHTLIPAQQR
jgi:tetratricopeptide (TPR) repeat protein